MNTQKIFEANVKIINECAYGAFYKSSWAQVTLDPQNEHTRGFDLFNVFQNCAVCARRIAELTNL
jgi:hypothetical protein